MKNKVIQPLSAFLAVLFLLFLLYPLFSAVFSFSPIPTNAQNHDPIFSSPSLPVLKGFFRTTRTHTTPLPEVPSPLPTAKQTNEQYRNLKVYAGGMPFGVKFLTEGVIIVGFHAVTNKSGSVTPAESAGLRLNDVILQVNGVSVSGGAELSRLVEESGGKTLDLLYSRSGVKHKTRLTPAYFEAEGRYSTGIYVRDSGAGIGTVTFILPKTKAFAGLGHGICDGETGALIPMQRGSVVDVTISGVVRGLAGSPGEVKGRFSSGKTGTLLGNTECGVYGVLADLPSATAKKTIPIGLRDEVRAGKATILCTTEGCTPKSYDVEISQIDLHATGNKCFTVKITDKDLISQTGGIIQGFSGSPIIQNGKLVGAVTHVLINDPTMGYGIFIENMLNQMGDLAS